MEITTNSSNTKLSKLHQTAFFQEKSLKFLYKKSLQFCFLYIKKVCSFFQKRQKSAVLHQKNLQLLQKKNKFEISLSFCFNCLHIEAERHQPVLPRFLKFPSRLQSPCQFHVLLFLAVRERVKQIIAVVAGEDRVRVGRDLGRVCRLRGRPLVRGRWLSFIRGIFRLVYIQDFFFTDFRQRLLPIFHCAEVTVIIPESFSRREEMIGNLG